MDDLQSFLRQRNVPESTIEEMELEKVDASIILLMTDEQLKTYLPSYGDRLAVLGYCRRKENKPKSRRTKLFDLLKSKLQKVHKDDDDDAKATPSQQALKGKNAQKNVRKVELGWMLFDDTKECFTQVRARRGGGTRKVDAGKEWTKTDLSERAIELFFPDGKSIHGNICDFEIDLKNYQECAKDLKTTVAQFYKDIKLPFLRFYLTTKSRKTPETSMAKTYDGELSENHEQTQVHISFYSDNRQPGTTLESINVSEVNCLGAIEMNNMNVASFAATEDQVEISYVTNDMYDSCIITFLTETIPNETDCIVV